MFRLSKPRSRIAYRSAALLTTVFVTSCASTTPVINDEVIDRIQHELAQLVDAPAPEKPMELVDHAEAVPEIRYPERFDVSVRNLTAQEFFLSLAKDTPYNLVVHPDLTGEITLDLKDVTIDDVLGISRDLYGYDFKRNGSFYQVFPAGLRTRVFHVDYLNIKRTGGSEIQVSAGQVTSAGASGGGSNTRGNLSSPQGGSQQGSAGLVGTRISTESHSDFWQQLSRTLALIVGNGDGRAVVTTPDAGMVVVRAEPDELLAVENYLNRAELIMQRQVILEAKILEVVLNEQFSQGIRWSAIAELANNTDADGNATRTLDLMQSSRNLVNPDLNGIVSAAIGTSDFDAFIELLSSQGDVQVLSSPRIATINNQKAVIKVGSDEFFVTEIRVDENNNVNSGDSTNTDVELTPFFSGIALDVTPQISDTGRIILHVHPSISEVEDQTKVVSLGDRQLTLPLALSTIRETDSIISADNGQVVVIGGLIRNVKNDDSAHVPLLGRVPVLGNAFRQRQVRETRSELVILIRPMMATPAHMMEDVQRSMDRFNQLSKH